MIHMRGLPKTRNFLSLRTRLLIASVCYGGGFLIATATLHGVNAGSGKLASPEIRLRLLSRFEDTYSCPPPVETPDSAPVPDTAQHDPVLGKESGRVFGPHATRNREYVPVISGCSSLVAVMQSTDLR